MTTSIPKRPTLLDWSYKKLLDNGNYGLTMPTSKIVKPLTYLLKKTLKVRLVELITEVIIDSKKLFIRLTVIGERELDVESYLQYEHHSQ